MSISSISVENPISDLFDYNTIIFEFDTSGVALVRYFVLDFWRELQKFKIFLRPSAAIKGGDPYLLAAALRPRVILSSACPVRRGRGEGGGGCS